MCRILGEEATFWPTLYSTDWQRRFYPQNFCWNGGLSAHPEFRRSVHTSDLEHFAAEARYLYWQSADIDAGRLVLHVY